MLKLFILLSLLISINLNGKVLSLQKENLSYIGEYLEVYEDLSSTKELKEIKKADFKALNKKVDSHTFSQSTLWYKTTINTSKNESRYIVFDLPWLDLINIHIIHEKHKPKQYTIGNILPFEKRSYKTNLLNIEHEFKKGNSTIFIQVKTRDPFIVPISILNKHELLEKIYKNQNIEFPLYSIMLSMLIFNFILYFVIKNKTYLFYTFFLASFLFASFSYNSYTFEYLTCDYPNIQNWLQSTSVFIYSIMGLLFTKSFLNLKTSLPKINLATKYLIYIFIFLMIFIAFFGYHYHVMLSITLTLVFSLYSISISFYAYLKGNDSAFYFILGSFAGLIGTAVTALSVMALIPYSWYMFKGADFGIVIDTILLSIALSKRYTIIYDNLQVVKEELHKTNINLESLVELRTEQLSLELKNKNILLKEISHRVKNNLQIVSSLLAMQIKDVEDQKAVNIVNENISRIKSMSLLYEKLLVSKDLEQINIKAYIHSIINEFYKTLNLKDININLKIEDYTFASDNLIPLGLIINELIINSTKHAFKKSNRNKEIEIEIITNKDTLALKYKDNGIGSKLEDVKKGFGYKILNSLAVYQLGGILDCYNKNGLNYELVFKKDAFN